MDELPTIGASRWESVLQKADKIASDAGTVGWARPEAAEIEVTFAVDPDGIAEPEGKPERWWYLH